MLNVYLPKVPLSTECECVLLTSVSSLYVWVPIKCDLLKYICFHYFGTDYTCGMLDYNMEAAMYGL